MSLGARVYDHLRLFSKFAFACNCNSIYLGVKRLTLRWYTTQESGYKDKPKAVTNASCLRFRARASLTRSRSSASARRRRTSENKFSASTWITSHQRICQKLVFSNFTKIFCVLSQSERPNISVLIRAVERVFIPRNRPVTGQILLSQLTRVKLKLFASSK